MAASQSKKKTFYDPQFINSSEKLNIVASFFAGFSSGRGFFQFPDFKFFFNYSKFCIACLLSVQAVLSLPIIHGVSGFSFISEQYYFFRWTELKIMNYTKPNKCNFDVIPPTLEHVQNSEILTDEKLENPIFRNTCRKNKLNVEEKEQSLLKHVETMWNQC